MSNDGNELLDEELSGEGAVRGSDDERDLEADEDDGCVSLCESLDVLLSSAESSFGFFLLIKFFLVDILSIDIYST